MGDSEASGGARLPAGMGLVIKNEGQWPPHFAWGGAVLKGRTPIGRPTIAVLVINAPHRIAQRVVLSRKVCS